MLLERETPGGPDAKVLNPLYFLLPFIPQVSLFKISNMAAVMSWSKEKDMCSENWRRAVSFESQHGGGNGDKQGASIGRQIIQASVSACVAFSYYQKYSSDDHGSLEFSF